MRHRLFAIHVFARSDGVNHNLFVPVVGHGHDDGVNALVVQQFFIAARRANRFFGDFLRHARAARRRGRRPLRTPGREARRYVIENCDIAKRARIELLVVTRDHATTFTSALEKR